MADLREIVSYLDCELRTTEITDFAGAHNGLQLSNSGRVDRVFAAVDASLAVIEEASRFPNSLLIVHHGLFWQGIQMIDGPFYKKLKLAMDADLAIYSSHLPLDIHPEIGNNVLLARAMGLTGLQPILGKKGSPGGISGKWSGSLTDFCINLEQLLGRAPVVCRSGAEVIENVAVITGGAGSAVRDIAELGMDLFVTGEGSHWTYIEAEECGLNTIYAGHYATETFGVRKLSENIEKKFLINAKFLPRNGGL
ncbi:Nif3-like dinuclear metal center hexameric protein [Luteolibacter sp. AS25]|uniref:Nif3-like dinuclear metal center hexameric protein n=1 Tax=Luteolibacter sp. AS25 TaxID=3135776 RepID=UPI00398AD180